MGEISVDDISIRFENHLTQDGNSRIIFSGQFGIGKTFFLNQFFEEKKRAIINF